MQHGLAHGLGGDGAGVDAGSADDLAHLDQGDFLAELGTINSGALACGAGTDDDQIVDTTHARSRLFHTAGSSAEKQPR
jgi:hypothetical protein